MQYKSQGRQRNNIQLLCNLQLVLCLKSKIEAADKIDEGDGDHGLDFIGFCIQRNVRILNIHNSFSSYKPARPLFSILSLCRGFWFSNSQIASYNPGTLLRNSSGFSKKVSMETAQNSSTLMAA